MLDAAGATMHYFHQLKSYLKFDKADENALKQLRPLAQPYYATIAEDFYDRLRKQPDALTIFRSDAQVLRLQKTLANWMDRLLSGPWGDEYFELRSRIGEVHVQISLPQQHMFSAMALIQEHLLGIAWEGLDGPDAQAAAAAVQKITNIDLAIMLQSYRDYFVGKVQHYERSEKEILESKLEMTQALYHSIFESSGVSIMVLDSKRRITLFNSMAETTSGYSRREITGKSLSDILLHPADRDAMQTLLDRVELGQPCPPKELRVITADQSDKWLRWNISRIADTGEICALALDVTREKRLAEHGRRVKTLAALGTLAAGLAHEIRNPLNAAQLQLMLVERAIKKAEGSVDARALRSSELVKAELTRLAGLVEDFLAFARPTQLRVANTDVSTLCQSVALLLEQEALGASCSLTTEISSGLVARVDGERLKQVLINLLRNAIEATSDEGKVLLRSQRIGQHLSIEVIDNGPGIPKGIDIFEPFATSKDAGTGLGLPIVDRIIADHGGSIEVARRDNTTIFTVDLPVDGPEDHG
ncbi:MAG: PAS domain S-box protein [Myxococcales bacterium]|nr:PAS domain S-box protein [Myxococcales bacterium]